MKKGKLFVIEGTDSSGKETQTKLLAERLKNEEINLLEISFPRYESPSSSLVKMYLSGEFGENANDVSAYAASVFYAADRYAAYKKEFGQFYENGGIIIADRYTTSNMIHQAGKIDNKNEKNDFLNWLYDLEYNKLGLPIPVVTFFLNMPIEKTKELMKNRKNKITNEDNKDIHEKDEEYLKKSYENACELAKKYEWKEVKCVKNNEIRTINDIHEEIYSIIRSYL